MYYDTVVHSRLDFHDIVKVRFLEEWTIDETSMIVTKNIAGISPIIKSFDSEGNFRGYKPLFWIYLDEDYPQKMGYVE